MCVYSMKVDAFTWLVSCIPGSRVQPYDLLLKCILSWFVGFFLGRLGHKVNLSMLSLDIGSRGLKVDLSKLSIDFFWYKLYYSLEVVAIR